MFLSTKGMEIRKPTKIGVHIQLTQIEETILQVVCSIMTTITKDSLYVSNNHTRNKDNPANDLSISPTPHFVVFVCDRFPLPQALGQYYYTDLYHLHKTTTPHLDKHV